MKRAPKQSETLVPVKALAVSYQFKHIKAISCHTMLVWGTTLCNLPGEPFAGPEPLGTAFFEGSLGSEQKSLAEIRTPLQSIGSSSAQVQHHFNIGVPSTLLNRPWRIWSQCGTLV